MVSLATSGWAEYVFNGLYMEAGANYFTVPVPYQRARWKPAGCQESKLVNVLESGIIWNMCTILGH